VEPGEKGNKAKGSPVFLEPVRRPVSRRRGAAAAKAGRGGAAFLRRSEAAPAIGRRIGGRRLKVEQQERKIGRLRYPCVTLATKP